MTKKIQKQFSITAWKNGAKIETRDGRSVRILCTDLNSIYDDKVIVAAVITRNGDESVRRFHQNGHYFNKDEDGADIVIVEEVEEQWADDRYAEGKGWFISADSTLCEVSKVYLNHSSQWNVFATEKQAKSALAMARISQLMAHDERYGGVVTDEEFRLAHGCFVIIRVEDRIVINRAFNEHYFLAFHTLKQSELFLAENEQLVKDYLMVD